MDREPLLYIQDKVKAYKPYFTQKRDNAKRFGLSPLQKIIVVLRILAYEVIVNFMDEYIRIRKSTAMESLKKFVTTIINIFFNEYLMSPYDNDITRLLSVGEQRGFPGMLENIDCMH